MNNHNKKALITGITGQDGAYLAEFLIKKGYEVHGLKRRTSLFNTQRIDHLYQDQYEDNLNFILHHGDMTDSTNIIRLIKEIEPDEIYNLAAQSHVRVSFDIPEYTADVTAMGALRILEAIRVLNLKKTKFYQASSSEMYGLVKNKKSLNEYSRFHPRSIYAVSKVFAYNTTINYREAYGIYASNGILFNHESPRRGPNFVTKKIVQGLVRIKKGLQKKLTLGNLYSVRDWGHARDYAESMWKILQYKKPDDWVIATNKEKTVKNFVNMTAKKLSMNIIWKGEGLNEKAYDRNTGKIIIDLDKKFLRPTEVDFLKGNFSKARKLLKWKPKTSTEQLVDDMVKTELSN